MPDTGQYFDADMGKIWVQPEGPNRPCYPLFCFNTDGFDESAGDLAFSMCKNEHGEWTTVHSAQGIPDAATASLETYVAKTMTWLDEMYRLRWGFGIYIHNAECMGDNFMDFDHTQFGVNTKVTSRSATASVRGNAAAGDGAADIKTRTYELTAAPLPPDIWDLIGNPITNTDPEPFRDIAFLGYARERGTVGPGFKESTHGCAVPDSAADPLFATPWILASDVATEAGTDPFATAEDIASVVEFELACGTRRILVACGTAGAAGLRVAYSDDDGDNWTPVVVDASNTDYAFHGGALNAIDYRHIWFGTFEADIYFSEDGGETWTDQLAPAPTGAESILDIHFVDTNFGWAVGGNSVGPTGYYVQTTDGGTIWAFAAAEPAVEQGTGVVVLDSANVWVVDDDGDLWFTEDWGATWTSRTAMLPSGPSTFGDIDAVNHYLLACCGNYNDGVDDFGVVYRSINGGYDWEEYVYETAFDSLEYKGLNAIEYLTPNTIYTVGDLVGTLGIIWKLINTQPTT